MITDIIFFTVFPHVSLRNSCLAVQGVLLDITERDVVGNIPVCIQVNLRYQSITFSVVQMTSCTLAQVG